MNQDIEGVLEHKIDSISENKNNYRIGRVIQVQDYILEVTGLHSVGYFERIYVGNKADGYVSKIGMNSVTVELVKKVAPIYIGDEVLATGHAFSAYFSSDSIGHIVDIFGQDQLTGRYFEKRVELSAVASTSSFQERDFLHQPLSTGIAAIDLFYPIGKGQRQLIMGAPKTGKTQIALDTIANQKNNNIICLYVSIGKSKKEVREVYSKLGAQGAMEYTIILSAFPNECSPALYIAPRIAMSIANRYLQIGNDVLVVLDDLKAHGDMYREMSLLMGNMPGAGAYPADILYNHATMLEKGCQHKNGGSITILPILERTEGDINDTLSSNLLSVVDGCIMTSSDQFQKGQKPAIDLQNSFSALGQKVQPKELQSLGIPLKNQLLATVDTETKKILSKGTIELFMQLRQGVFSPRSTAELVEKFSGYLSSDTKGEIQDDVVK